MASRHQDLIPVDLRIWWKDSPPIVCPCHISWGNQHGSLWNESGFAFLVVLPLRVPVFSKVSAAYLHLSRPFHAQQGVHVHRCYIMIRHYIRKQWTSVMCRLDLVLSCHLIVGDVHSCHSHVSSTSASFMLSCPSHIWRSLGIVIPNSWARWEKILNHQAKDSGSGAAPV